MNFVNYFLHLESESSNQDTVFFIMMYNLDLISFHSFLASKIVRQKGFIEIEDIGVWDICCFFS